MRVRDKKGNNVENPCPEKARKRSTKWFRNKKCEDPCGCGGGYTKRYRTSSLQLFFFQRRPVPMLGCHEISLTRSRGDRPLLVPVGPAPVPVPAPAPAPALVIRALTGPVPKGGEGVPIPDVSLAVRRAAVRFLGAIVLFSSGFSGSTPLRDGLSAGARLGSISRASSRTSTAPSLRRSDATVSWIP